MPYKKLRIEVANRVGYILLDAGLRFNKLSITTIRELKRAVAQVEADDAVQAVVLSEIGRASCRERVCLYV